MQDKSGNPALKNSAIDRLGVSTGSGVATLSGTVMKIVLLLVIVAITGAFGWRSAAAETHAGLLWIALIGGAGLGFATVFKPNISPITAPLYAVCEGFLLGFISQIFSKAYGNIVVEAILITLGITISTLILYLSGLVKVDRKFMAVVMIATLGVGIFYLGSIIFSLFGANFPLVNSTSSFGIIFSIVVIFIAALNLLLDFAFIATAAKSGKAPKVFEWYGAFSLLVTLVWLYLEVLRLLGKARSN